MVNWTSHESYSLLPIPCAFICSRSACGTVQVSEWPRPLRRGLGALEHWDRGFESRSSHGCMSASFRVLLSHISRGLAMDRSPIQGVLPKCLEGFWGVKLTTHSHLVPWSRMRGELHAFLTSALQSDEWSASRPGRFTSGTHWTGAWWTSEPV
jgi:hypothetical protein